jgi:hypothetical protein
MRTCGSAYVCVRAARVPVGACLCAWVCAFVRMSVRACVSVHVLNVRVHVPRACVSVYAVMCARITQQEGQRADGKDRLSSVRASDHA